MGEAEYVSSLPFVADRCGGAHDLKGLGERVTDADASLFQTAHSIYRGDIIRIVANATPWWRVKMWQIGFGLGLWSGQLDEPSGYLSADQIEQARRFSERWYRRVTDQITCDAVRSAKAGKPPI
jgi:hypothetical protein